MSEQKEPREFWVDPVEDGEDGYIQVYQALSKHPKQGPLQWQTSLIHVIEKSAYDALKAENERLQKWIDSDNTIEQRDAHEDRINEIANALGDQSDWSNMNDRGENALELVYELKARLAECEEENKELKEIIQKGISTVDVKGFLGGGWVQDFIIWARETREYFKKWGGDE